MQVNSLSCFVLDYQLASHEVAGRGIISIAGQT